MKNLLTISLASLAVSVFVLSGCTDSPDSTPMSSNSTGSVDHQKDDDHDHDAHPSEGPHHGHLIELGGEEYHAELVHDEDAVTIYILDGAAKKGVPIEATDIAINLQHDGKGEQFKLSASPDQDDPKGKSSRFVSNDQELSEDLYGEDAEVQLVLKIAGKSYRGTVEHDHEH